MNTLPTFLADSTASRLHALRILLDSTTAWAAAAPNALSPAGAAALDALVLNLSTPDYSLVVAPHPSGMTFIMVHSAVGVVCWYSPAAGGLLNFAAEPLLPANQFNLHAYADSSSRAAREYVRRKLLQLIPRASPPSALQPRASAVIGAA